MKPGMRIKQIIPADGWRVVYGGKGKDGKVDVFTQPLVAWALVTDPSEDAYPDSVEPIADAGGYMGVVDSDISNYLGVLGPGEDIERYRQEVEESN